MTNKACNGTDVGYTKQASVIEIDEVVIVAIDKPRAGSQKPASPSPAFGRLHGSNRCCTSAASASHEQQRNDRNRSGGRRVDGPQPMPEKTAK